MKRQMEELKNVIDYTDPHDIQVDQWVEHNSKTA